MSNAKQKSSRYHRKKTYLHRLSRKAGRRVWGFEIPMEGKVWR